MSQVPWAAGAAIDRSGTSVQRRRLVCKRLRAEEQQLHVRELQAGSESRNQTFLRRRRQRFMPGDCSSQRVLALAELLNME